jgi:two-component system CheB/CheR fusion protein
MGLDKLDVSRVNLTDVIYECRDNFKDNFEREMVLNIDGDYYINADREKIFKVLHNLVENAFKYSAPDEKVILAVKKENDRIRISIQDFGLGIEEDKVKHVFDRYYRVEHTSQNYAGMGLGLYICAQIVNQHGGSIGVESKIGKGSTFWFELPLAKDQLAGNELVQKQS